MKRWGMCFLILQWMHLGFCSLLGDVPDSVPLYRAIEKGRLEGVDAASKLQLADFEPGSPASSERKKIIRALEASIQSADKKKAKDRLDQQGNTQKEESNHLTEDATGFGGVLDDWVEQMDP